jgi:hypothetical protein
MFNTKCTFNIFPRILPIKQILWYCLIFVQSKNSFYYQKVERTIKLSKQIASELFCEYCDSPKEECSMLHFQYILDKDALAFAWGVIVLKVTSLGTEVWKMLCYGGSQFFFLIIIFVPMIVCAIMFYSTYHHNIYMLLSSFNLNFWGQGLNILIVNVLILNV